VRGSTSGLLQRGVRPVMPMWAQLLLYLVGHTLACVLWEVLVSRGRRGAAMSRWGKGEGCAKE